jgi:hypothetical protein
MAFEFREGIFIRPGQPATQKAISEVNKVLRLPALKDANLHFNKARHFYSNALNPDFPNAVKEAVSALEASAKSLFPKLKKLDFDKLLKKLEGTGEHQIPPTIAKSMGAIYAFRGSGSQVAHGGATGGHASVEVAELVVSLSAAFITYLAGLERRIAEQETVNPAF